ncbi:hypothetical protein OX283_002385 [Flavobacterium sp. SUN052]|uniref:hypothetical protein n=1 Tax=Flavobacterium sp. SUN052 TaxID=3002441 RepID=UPI00237E41FF|nr:hypothetical protein [Flavobacterium sp. SUN052]MEC4003493.1 hypothetical protein [Flavobacterium sp. SUN052]
MNPITIMNLNKYKPILETALLSIIVFVIHETFFILIESQEKEFNFRYPLYLLYLFFLICSVIIVYILIRIKERNIDSVGQTFLLLTCIKMVLAYILLHPILQATNKLVTPEKINFFMVFAVFLTIETVVTIRILNKNQ